jgi:hypothetical protein
LEKKKIRKIRVRGYPRGYLIGTFLMFLFAYWLLSELKVIPNISVIELLIITGGGYLLIKLLFRLD